MFPERIKKIIRTLRVLEYGRAPFKLTEQSVATIDEIIAFCLSLQLSEMSEEPKNHKFNSGKRKSELFYKGTCNHFPLGSIDWVWEKTRATLQDPNRHESDLYIQVLLRLNGREALYAYRSLDTSAPAMTWADTPDLSREEYQKLIQLIGSPTVRSWYDMVTPDLDTDVFRRMEQDESYNRWFWKRRIEKGYVDPTKRRVTHPLQRADISHNLDTTKKTAHSESRQNIPKYKLSC